MSQGLEMPDGLSYRVSHKRLFPTGTDDNWDQPLPYGGSTRVEVGVPRFNEQGEFSFFDTVSVGEAACSLMDNYSKKRGRDIALGRALKKLQKG